MLDLLCIGDSVVDIFLEIPPENRHFGLNRETKKLFIDLGYKINLKGYTKDVGGNATNTAIGVSRLGKRVGLCTEIGDDEFSHFILNKLEAEKINTNLMIKDKNTKTSFSVSLNYLGERTLLVEHVERQHDFKIDNSSARFIYLTSLGNEWKKAYENVRIFLNKTNSKLAYNPGTLQLEEKGKIFFELIQSSDYFFVNKQEAEKILYGNDKKDADIKKLLFGIKNLGAKNIIITDSSRGSYLIDTENNIYHLGIVKTDVIEKTGAGDAYTSGFIAAILNGEIILDAMRWGAINSSSVISKIGAQEGLLNLRVLKDRLNYLNSFKPKIFT